MKRLPLIARSDFEQCWIVTEQSALTVAEVLFYAKELAQRLPDQRYILLMCEKRINFIIGFMAAMWRGQTAMLAPDRSMEVIQSLQSDYPDCGCLTDADTSACNEKTFQYDYASSDRGRTTEIPLIDTQHQACLVFTSGSTGRPVANVKYWGDLVQGVDLLRLRYGFNENDYLVATVPPQHMYGLETTVLLPMMNPVSVFGGMPFFPEDIRQALLLTSKPPTLLSTPLHLRVCVQAKLDWPRMSRLISATAALARNDAAQAEKAFGAGLIEIYGSTESGAIASRRTVNQQSWKLYDDVKLIAKDDRVWVCATYLSHRPVLADRIEILDDEHFLMFGRTSDMIKIAGKRASLAGLNHRLLSIPGVEDGVFLKNEICSDKMSRLCVVFVSSGLSTADVFHALGRQIDPVFLPRRLFKVATLPRSETGKLPQSEMKKLLGKLMGQ